MAEGFIIRVAAYYGEPVDVCGLPTRAGTVNDLPFDSPSVARDLSDNSSISDVGDIVDGFEEDYGCKVDFWFSDDKLDGATVHEFDVFEPSWPTKEEADAVIDDLTGRLAKWVTDNAAGEPA